MSNPYTAIPYRTTPVLVLDLDGTIRFSISGDFIKGPNDVALFPDVEAVLWRYRDNGYHIFGITNQGGVAYGYKTEVDVLDENAATRGLFERDPFHDIYYALGHPAGKVAPFNNLTLLRKPYYGLLAVIEYDLLRRSWIPVWHKSLIVGDSLDDEYLAKAAGITFSAAAGFFGRTHASET